MHASQLSMLSFKSAEDVDRAVRAYATSVGAKDKPQERFWTLDNNRNVIKQLNSIPRK
jgi:hypothetical protein